MSLIQFILEYIFSHAFSASWEVMGPIPDKTRLLQTEHPHTRHSIVRIHYCLLQTSPCPAQCYTYTLLSITNIPMPGIALLYVHVTLLQTSPGPAQHTRYCLIQTSTYEAQALLYIHITVYYKHPHARHSIVCTHYCGKVFYVGWVSNIIVLCVLCISTHTCNMCREPPLCPTYFTKRDVIPKRGSQANCQSTPANPWLHDCGG